MNHRNSRKVDQAVAACRRACLGTVAPLTNYWLTVELLEERPDWNAEDVLAFRERFVASLISDLGDWTEPREVTPAVADRIGTIS